MAMRKMMAGRSINPPTTAPGTPKSAKGTQSRALSSPTR